LLFSTALPPNNEHGDKTQRKLLKWAQTFKGRGPALNQLDLTEVFNAKIN
jgi:hypothetical protein